MIEKHGTVHSNRFLPGESFQVSVSCLVKRLHTDRQREKEAIVMMMMMMMTHNSKERLHENQVKHRKSHFTTTITHCKRGEERERGACPMGSARGGDGVVCEGISSRVKRLACVCVSLELQSLSISTCVCASTSTPLQSVTHSV